MATFKVGPVKLWGFLFALVLGAVPKTLRADSDGYYCTGRGYLAYETRWSISEPGHFLHVVRFSVNGIHRFPAIRLPDFQVRQMRCMPATVEVNGASTSVVVHVSDAKNPRVETRSPSGAFPSNGITRNLGHRAVPGVIDLDSDAATGTFQLAILRQTRIVAGGLEHYTVSLLIRRDPKLGLADYFEDCVTLFSGASLETID